MYFSSILDDQQIGINARTSGYLTTEKASPNALDNPKELKTENDPVRNQLFFKDGDIPTFDYTNAQAFIWPGRREWNWFSDLRPVTNLDAENRVIYLKPSPGYLIDKNMRYYLQGAKEFIDSPGEFYNDSQNGVLYYYPYGNIDDTDIIIPTSNRLIEIKGNEATVKNIEFNGLTMSNTTFDDEYLLPTDNDEKEHARNGLIHIENAENITIKNCVIENAGYSGIMLNGHAQNNLIYGNRIENIGFNGIYLAGYKEDRGDYVNNKNKVQNNYVTNVGKFVGHGTGIALLFSGDNTITNNKVSNAPRYGISMKGYPVANGAEKYTKNNYIAYNNISNVMTDTQDGGAIEWWNAGDGNIIENNHIHSIYDNGLIGSVIGIYSDDDSNHVTVRNNIISNMYGRTSLPILFKGNNSILENNIITNSRGSVDMVLNGGAGTTVSKNIVSVEKGDQFYVYSGNYEHEIDNNILHHPNGNNHVAASGSLSFTEWLNRYDKNSLIQDPLFTNSKNQDFSLKEGSPAFALGFRSIDQSSIGLKEDFPQYASDKIEAEVHNQINNAQIYNIGVTSTGSGGYIKYSNADFRDGMTMVQATIGGGNAVLRLDGVNGTIIGEISGNSSAHDELKKQYANIEKTSGKHDLYVIFPQAGVSLDYIRFFKDRGHISDILEIDQWADYKYSINPMSYAEASGVSEVGGVLEINDGYVKYNDIRFERNNGDIVLDISGANGQVIIRRDSINNEPVAVQALIEGTNIINLQNVHGVHDIYLTFTNSVVLKAIKLEPESKINPTHKRMAVDYDMSLGITSHGTIGSTSPNDYVMYKNVDFDNPVTKLVASLGVLPEYAGGGIEIRLDSPTGTKIGQLDATSTDGWYDFAEQETIISTVSGIHDLYLVFNNHGVCNFHWFRFE